MEMEQSGREDITRPTKGTTRRPTPPRPAPHLQHSREQVALPAGEAAPVGEHKEGQPLQVKLLHGLRGLERRVGEPDLAGLRGREGRGGAGAGEGID